MTHHNENVNPANSDKLHDDDPIPQRKEWYQGLTTEHKQRLTHELNVLPEHWKLCAVDRHKAPFKEGWQTGNTSRDELRTDIRRGFAKGYGLLTGKISGGLLAVDADGELAHAKLNELGGLPPTVAFTSGRPGRCQYLLQVPEEYWEVLHTFKIKAGKGEDNKVQLLEFRWDGCQSVLPPSNHPETGEYHWVNKVGEVEIAECPTWIIEQCLNLGVAPPTPAPLPSPKDTPAWAQLSIQKQHFNELKDIPIPVPGRVPLYNCLAKSSRALIDAGVAEGGRNDAGIRLALDVAGTVRYLSSIGQAYEGDPDELLSAFASKCSPPFPRSELQQVAASATKRNAAPSSREGGVAACIRGWYWQYLKQEGCTMGAGAATNKQTNQSTGDNTVDMSTGGDSSAAASERPVVIVANKPKELVESSGFVSSEKLEAALQELIDKDLPSAHLSTKLFELSKQFRCSQRELRSLYLDIQSENERAENREQTQKDIDAILSAKAACYDISSALPGRLANALKLLASNLGVKPESYLTTLLTIVSTLHRNQTSLTLWKATDFDVSPGLFSAIVADPSQYKSPILKAMKKPLATMQAEAKREYEQKMADYELELMRWERQNKNGGKDAPEPEPKPVPPARRLYYFTNSTSEGIVRQFSDNPAYGVLELVDELAGKFKSANMYRRGRGGDEEELLSLYDGVGKVTLRASGIKSDLADGLNYGLLGSIQPQVLHRLMKDCEDSNGNWSRFLYIYQPLATSEWTVDSENTGLTEMLYPLYCRIASLPSINYTLSAGAKECFRIARNHFEKLRVSDPSQGMRSYWGKCPGRIGKLALNLHVINYLFDGEDIPSVLSEKCMRQAIALTNFYAHQVSGMYADFEVDKSELSVVCSKILEIAKLAGGSVSTRDLCRRMKHKSEDIKTYCKELVILGRGSLTEAGRSAVFHLNKDGNAETTVQPTEPPPTPPAPSYTAPATASNKTPAKESVTRDKDGHENKTASSGSAQPVSQVESTTKKTGKDATKKDAKDAAKTVIPKPETGVSVPGTWHPWVQEEIDKDPDAVSYTVTTSGLKVAHYRMLDGADMVAVQDGRPPLTMAQYRMYGLRL